MASATLASDKQLALSHESESDDSLGTLRGLHVAYLMNQHPSPSVSFIRREIVGLESMGASVSRFSIRRWQGQLVDPADKYEFSKTTFLLDRGIWLLWDAVVCFLTSPLHFFNAVKVCAKVGWTSDRGPLRTWMYLIEACRLKRLAGQQDIPWVHAHFGTNSAAVAMFCRLLGGPPYSFTVHGPEEFDRPELLHLREKIKHADMVIAISHFCRSQLYRWCDWEEWGKIKIIRCGISETFAAQAPRPIDDTPRLICVARLAEQKGLPVLMDAAASLVRAGVDFRLDVMGDGVLRKPLEELIVREGLQEHVFLRGWQTEAQIREGIESSRALVLPSFAEGLPVVLMEALALGRPVVCTRIAGISELVVDGENGWLVNASDAESLGAAMRTVLEAETDKLSAMGQCGAERVFARHLAKDEALRLGALFLDHQAGSSVSLTGMGSDPLGRGQ